MKTQITCRIPGIGLLVAGAAALAFCHAPAKAGSVTYTASGSDTDGTLGAQAVITTSGGQVQIVLSNLLAADVIRSSGEAISGISITFGSALGTDGTNTASGQIGNVDKNGNISNISGSPTAFLGDGGTFSASGNTISMSVLGSGGQSPMIAPSAPGGVYSNANGGFRSQDPYTIGPATFKLALTGVTGSTTVTAVTFYFGTGTPPFSLAGAPVPVPEPASLISAATAGLFGLGYGWRRRSRKA